MKKTGIIYGSSTGTCEDLAGRIAEKLGISSDDVYSVDKLTAELVDEYEALLLGTSTWGEGELQDDWYDGLSVLQGANLAGKTIALFGCGDSDSYPDTFCDGIAGLYDGLKDSGATFIGGGVSADDYNYSSSASVVDGAFIGLALDEVNESDKTDDRIDAWVAALQAEL